MEMWIKKMHNSRTKLNLKPKSKLQAIYPVLMYICSQEVVVQRCSIKKVFLEISQNSQENTCARASFLITLPDCWGGRAPMQLTKAYSCIFVALQLILREGILHKSMPFRLIQKLCNAKLSKLTYCNPLNRQRTFTIC